MSVQVKFTIRFEYQSEAPTAVTSLTEAASSGILAETFTEKAAERNVVVDVFVDIVDTTCDGCDEASEVVVDLDVSITVYNVVAAVLLTIALMLIGLWVILGRDTHRAQVPTNSAANNCKNQIYPALLTVEERDTAHVRPRRGSMLAIGIPDVPTHLHPDLDKGDKLNPVVGSDAESCQDSKPPGHHPLDIIQAAALHCG